MASVFLRSFFFFANRLWKNNCTVETNKLSTEKGLGPKRLLKTSSLSISILLFNAFCEKMKTKIAILVIMNNEKEYYVLVMLRNFGRDAQRVYL